MLFSCYMCIHYQGGTLDCNNIFIVTYGNWLSILTISEFCGLSFIPGCFLMSFMIDHIVMLCKPRGGRGDGGRGVAMRVTRVIHSLPTSFKIICNISTDSHIGDIEFMQNLIYYGSITPPPLGPPPIVCMW